MMTKEQVDRLSRCIAWGTGGDGWTNVEKAEVLNEVVQLQAELAKANERADACKPLLDRATKALDEKDARISGLKARVENLFQTITMREKSEEAKDARIAELESAHNSQIKA